MDGATLQNRIYSGYGKAALRIGTIYQQYRPAGSGNPLAAQRGTLYASMNAEDFTYSRPNKYGKPTWFGVFDGSLTQPGDYLVGGEGTFFIAAQQLNLPILCVQCNRMINIYRPQQQTGIGVQGYGGTIDGNETMLMQQWPASILQGTKGEKSEAALPGDVRTPWWAVLLPYCAGVNLRTGDIITDDLSRRYVISSAELTDLGWRMTASQAET